MKFWLGTVVAVMALGTIGCADDEDTSGTGGDVRAPAILAINGDVSAGATVYGMQCGNASCHGGDGTGSATARNLNQVVPTLDDATLIDVILNGSVANGAVMPGLASQLSDQDVADVVAYCRATFDP